MTITYTENIFETRYRDDYADSDNFHRILFNKGKALQARELTQLQTIIQKQIERFGSALALMVRERCITSIALRPQIKQSAKPVVAGNANEKFRTVSNRKYHHQW